MTQPRFLADGDLRGSIVRVVRRMAPEIEMTTVVEEGLSSAADHEVLEYAWRPRWLLISHDVNTMKSAADRLVAGGRGIHGLFLAPQSQPTGMVAKTLVLIWSASTFEEWQDRIVYLPL